MIRVLIGFVAGVYLTQNYKVPDVKLWVKFIQTSLVEYEKDLPKNKK
jgi:hypothetical protein